MYKKAKQMKYRLILLIAVSWSDAAWTIVWQSNAGRVVRTVSTILDLFYFVSIDACVTWQRCNVVRVGFHVHTYFIGNSWSDAYSTCSKLYVISHLLTARRLIQSSLTHRLLIKDIYSLQHRRQQQARDFFRSLLDPNSCLHSLLPTPRDPNLVTRLRAARRFPALASRTKKYQCFINFGLLNYQ